MINHLALNTPYFGILLSVIPFFLATILFENKSFLLIRTAICQYGIWCSLYLTGIPYKTYKIGGDIIYFFLEPATICFAIPLYKSVKCLLNIGIVSSEVLVSVQL